MSLQYCIYFPLLINYSMIKLINLTILTSYCSLIFYLSSRSSIPAPLLFPHQDKIIHFGAYFVMAVLAWRLFKDFCSFKTAIWLSFCFCSLYGISDEWHQAYVPGRDADVLDWLADSMGAATALCCIQWLNKKRPAI